MRNNLFKFAHRRRFMCCNNMLTIAYTIFLFILTGCASGNIENDVSSDVIHNLSIIANSDSSEFGYNLDVEIENIPLNMFSNDIQNSPEVFEKQFENYKLQSSSAPEIWQQDFHDNDEAVRFIGYEQLIPVNLNTDEHKTSVSVIADTSGLPAVIELETDYSEAGILLQSFAQLYTEHYTDDVVIHNRTTEASIYSESSFITTNEKKIYVVSSATTGSDIEYMDGYIVENNVLYRLHLAYQTQNSEKAIDLLHQWANNF